MWQSFCNYNIVCLHQSTEPEGIPGFNLDKPWVQSGYAQGSVWTRIKHCCMLLNF